MSNPLYLNEEVGDRNRNIFTRTTNKYLILDLDNIVTKHITQHSPNSNDIKVLKCLTIL